MSSPFHPTSSSPYSSSISRSSCCPSTSTRLVGTLCTPPTRRWGLRTNPSSEQLKEKQKKRIKEPWRWFWAWQRLSSVSASLWCGPGRRTSASQGRSCGCCAVNYEHQRRVQFEGCVAEPLQTISAILPGSKGSCLLLRIVLQDTFSEVTKIYLPLKLGVFVDDILWRRNRDVAEMAKKVMKKMKEEVEKNGLELSVTENGKEGKSKMIASCGFPENELRQFSREEGMALADSLEILSVVLRTRVIRPGAKENSWRIRRISSTTS